jgi:hypothetical protein
LEKKAVKEELPNNTIFCRGEGEDQNEGVLLPQGQRVRVCDGLTALTLLESLDARTPIKQLIATPETDTGLVNSLFHHRGLRKEASDNEEER